MGQGQSELARASQALADGRVAEAERLLSKVLKKNPTDADAHNLRALAFIRREAIGPALKHAKKAVELNPDNHRYRGNLGSALMVDGKSDEALAQLTRAIEISPDYVQARRNRGVLNLLMQRFDEAVEDFSVVVRHAPNRADARIALADALIEVGRFDEATEQLKTAESLEGKQTAPLKYMWGRLMFRTGRFKEARQAFTSTLLDDPDKMEIMIALGAAAYRGGKLRDAERITEACFRKYPTGIRSPAAPEKQILVLEPLKETYFSSLPRGTYQFHTANYIAFMPAEKFSYTHAVYMGADTLASTLELDKYDLVVNNCVVPETFDMNHRAPQQQEIESAFSVDVINPPRAVAQTTRALNAEIFADAEKFVFPRTIRVDHRMDCRETVSRILEAMSLPLILRPLNTHVGAGAILIQNEKDLEWEIAHGAFTEFYAIEYHDSCSEDGLFRRYRFSCIGGNLTANSLHISRDWNVHGHDRDNLDWNERGFDKEEKSFYDDPVTLLGAEPADIFSEIVEKTPLDVYGFDFGFRRSDRRIVVYEINAAMALSLDAKLHKYPHRKPYRDRVVAEVEAYFRSRMRQG